MTIRRRSPNAATTTSVLRLVVVALLVVCLVGDSCRITNFVFTVSAWMVSPRTTTRKMSPSLTTPSSSWSRSTRHHDNVIPATTHRQGQHYSFLALTTPTFSFVSSSNDEDNNNNNNKDDLEIEFDENDIRKTYDEWRPFFNKGDFSTEKYQVFQRNYKTLTKANIKARDQALKDNKPIPPWMQLNQYADLTLDEYNALVVEEKNKKKQTTKDDGAGDGVVVKSSSSSPSAGIVQSVPESVEGKLSLTSLQKEKRSVQQQRQRQLRLLEVPSLLFEPKVKQELRVIENHPKCAELLFMTSSTLSSSPSSSKHLPSSPATRKNNNGGRSKNPQKWKGPTIVLLDNVEVDKFVDMAKERLFLY